MGLRPRPGGLAGARRVKIIRDPALRETLWKRQWIDPVGSAPEEVTKVMRAESARWADIVKAAGIAAD